MQALSRVHCESSFWTDVAHLSCPDYQSCPEIDGVQMHCDHRNGKCRCPTGTQRHNSQCVGASLRSHEGDKFLKNLEKSVRLVQNGFRIPTVTAICYDQPSVERCYCGEREDYPGAPVCDCGSMTPRSVVCLSRLTNMEIFGECLGGYICSLESNVYEDIDECSRPELNDCDLIRGTCHNTPGSYECICVDGREWVHSHLLVCKIGTVGSLQPRLVACFHPLLISHPPLATVVIAIFGFTDSHANASRLRGRLTSAPWTRSVRESS